MTNEKKPIEVVFAPGCFDSFEGTQAELDELVKEITDMFTTGDLDSENLIPLEDLSDEEIQEFMENMIQVDGPRVLQ